MSMHLTRELDNLCISRSKLKRFLSYFVDKVGLLYKIPKSEKGDNSAKYLQNFAKH